MTVTEERLTPLDATFLELEQSDECSLMHIGGALIFDPQNGDPAHPQLPTLEELHQVLEERFDMLPRFRCRLSEPRTHGLRWPAWVQDTSFDLAAHVRHATLPSPGGEAELHEWLADFWSHKLDRSRPLWEMTLVDGLEDGGWMLATKTHHAMVDGVGSMDIGHVLLDAEPRPAPRPPAHVNGNGYVSDNGRHLPGWLAPAVAAARTAVGAARHPSRIVHAGEAAVAMGEMVWQDEILAARDSSLNVPIGATRRFVSVPFDLDEVKAVKRSLGGTVNDVVLAVTTGALRRLLASRGDALDRPLRAMVPVNLRSDGHGSLGNRVTSLFVELPVGEGERRRRYVKTRAAANELKSGTAALGGTTLVQVIGYIPPVLHESIARTLFAPRLFNLTITNVPGPQMTLYSMGSRMRRIIPLVPLFADHTIGLAIVSYDGELVFGINADFATTPDLEFFEAALREEFEQLRALAAD